MRWTWLVFVLSIALSACRSERGASSSAATDASVEGADLLGEPEPDDTDDGGAYVLTAEKLDKYVAYQERTLALYAQMMDELARADAQAAAKGAPKDGGTAAMASSMARVRKHAEAQDRIRRELGLTQRDVRELERLVGDVISRRAMSNAADEDASIKQMEELAAKLPEEQRAEFTETIASLKKQQEETRSLAEERKKYGDANVDLVLTREVELTRQWNQAIATFAGTKEKTPARPGDGGVVLGTDGGARQALGGDGGIPMVRDGGATPKADGGLAVPPAERHGSNAGTHDGG